MRVLIIFLATIATFLFSGLILAAPPTDANRFFILKPSDSVVGTPVIVTIEARRGNTVDTNYQNDVTLVTTGSATGAGLVDIVNGVGSLSINDLVAEVVILSLSDTESTGLDVGSTREVTFAAIDDGGDGGGGGRRPTTVTFSGRAFPYAQVLILDRVGQIDNVLSQNTAANSDGEFNVSYVGIQQSKHNFGLVIKDLNGLPTQTKFYDIDTNANNLTVKDVLVPPTVSLWGRAVTRGRNLIVTGSALPNSEIIVEVDGSIENNTSADRDGHYKLSIDTGALDFSSHQIRVKQIDPGNKRESDFSLTQAFTVSRLVMPGTDLSGDDKVDITDWSIFISSWASKDENKRKMIDFNQDGKVDVSDFAIFVHTIRK